MNPEETEHCGCGGRGHLEQYASATGVVRLAAKALRASDRASTLRSVSKLTAKSVFDAAKAEDALALEIVETMGDVLGRALAMISCVADPEIYVIGGGVSKAGAILLDAIREHFRKYAFHASRSTEFALAQLGNDAGMYGAVRMVMEQDWE
jgi:glucokinase